MEKNEKSAMKNIKAGSPSNGLSLPTKAQQSNFRKEKRHFYKKSLSTIFFLFCRLLGRLKKRKKKKLKKRKKGKQKKKEEKNMKNKKN